MYRGGEGLAIGAFSPPGVPATRSEPGCRMSQPGPKDASGIPFALPLLVYSHPRAAGHGGLGVQRKAPGSQAPRSHDKKEQKRAAQPNTGTRINTIDWGGLPASARGTMPSAPC